jgi:hypothetical protein
VIVVPTEKVKLHLDSVDDDFGSPLVPTGNLVSRNLVTASFDGLEVIEADRGREPVPQSPPGVGICAQVVGELRSAWFTAACGLDRWMGWASCVGL